MNPLVPVVIKLIPEVLKYFRGRSKKLDDLIELAEDLVDAAEDMFLDEDAEKMPEMRREWVWRGLEEAFPRAVKRLKPSQRNLINELVLARIKAPVEENTPESSVFTLEIGEITVRKVP